MRDLNGEAYPGSPHNRLTKYFEATDRQGPLLTLRTKEELQGSQETWARKSRRDPSEPHASSLLPELLSTAFRRKAQVVLWRNALAPLLRRYSPKTLDHRGLLLSNSSAMALPSHRRYVLNWVREVLGLKECPGWERRAPSFVRELVDDFAVDSGTWIYLVVVESCRDNIRYREPGFTERLCTDRSQKLLKLRRSLPLVNGEKLSTKGLHWESSLGVVSTNTVISQVPQFRAKRTDDGEFTAAITRWCAADNGERIAHVLPNGVNLNRIMTFAKLDAASGCVDSYTVDLNPVTGGVKSIRHSWNRLRMWTESDPWLNDWLCQVVGR